MQTEQLVKVEKERLNRTVCRRILYLAKHQTTTTFFLERVVEYHYLHEIVVSPREHHIVSVSVCPIMLRVESGVAVKRQVLSSIVLLVQ